MNAEELHQRAEENLCLMRVDSKSDWQDRLLHDLAQAPIVDELEMPPESMLGSLNYRQSGLTPAMILVLECGSRGLTVKMTALTLGISPETVRTELKQARYLLKAKTTSHAIAEALRQGLIS